MDIKELTKGLSAEQRKALMEELSKAEQQEQIDRRETYEALRRDFLEEVKSKVLGLADVTKAFRNWLDSSARGFYDLMREYGHLRNDGQLSFSITEGDFKLEVRSNKVKGFDERADVAAERLIEYLKKYISNSTKGADDPMYQLAMSLNSMGWRISSTESIRQLWTCSARAMLFSRLQSTTTSGFVTRTRSGTDLSQASADCKQNPLQRNCKPLCYNKMQGLFVISLLEMSIFAENRIYASRTR